MKIIMILLLLCLIGCGTNHNDFIFDGEVIPMDKLTLSHRKTPIVREKITLDGQELNKFMALFNHGQLEIRKYKEGEREIELVLEKEGEVTGKLIGYRDTDDDLLLCLNDETVCRVYNNATPLSTIEGGERIEESYKPMLLPVKIQGFEGSEPAPYHFTVIDVEKTADGDIYTFAQAGFATLDSGDYLMKENGELAGPILDEPYGDYELIHSQLDEFIQRKLILKDGKVTYIDWEKEAIIKPAKPLEINDFELIKGKLVVYSNFIQVKGLEDYFANSMLSLKMKENDNYISCIFTLDNREQIKFIFDKVSGQMLNEYGIHLSLNTPIEEKVKSALSDLPVCSMYYEDNYEISKCYEPYVFDEGRIHHNITLFQTKLEINDLGQIVLPVVIREKGAYAGTVDIEIIKE